MPIISVNGLTYIGMMQVVGNSNTLTLAYKLVCPFGCITSVGVHGESQLPFSGSKYQLLYAFNK